MSISLDERLEMSKKTADWIILEISKLKRKLASFSAENIKEIKLLRAQLMGINSKIKFEAREAEVIRRLIIGLPDEDLEDDECEDDGYKDDEFDEDKEGEEQDGEYRDE